MKKLILLSLIVAAVISVAFISKPKPPSFVVDMENFGSFMEAKEAELSHTTSHEDSTLILHDIDVEISELKNKWDIEDEATRLPKVGLAACVMHCSIVYALCHDSGGGEIGTWGCYSNYVYCRFGCSLSY